MVHFAQVVLGGGNAPGVGPCFRDLSPRVGWPRFSRDGIPEGSQPAFAVRECCPWADSPSIRSTTERPSLPPSSRYGVPGTLSSSLSGSPRLPVAAHVRERRLLPRA